jgi:hypothetical protein
MNTKEVSSYLNLLFQHLSGENEGPHTNPLLRQMIYGLNIEPGAFLKRIKIVHYFTATFDKLCCLSCLYERLHTRSLLYDSLSVQLKLQFEHIFVQIFFLPITFSPLTSFILELIGKYGSYRQLVGVLGRVCSIPSQFSMTVQMESQRRCTQLVEHPCFCIGLICSEDYVRKFPH